jgi:ABC-type oligopeptide transport system substrate-binding subunit
MRSGDSASASADLLSSRFVSRPDPVRNAVHAAFALALALAPVACAPSGDDATLATHGRRWFGSIQPPRGNVLRFNNGAEPETIDPSIMSGQTDGRIARLLFEGLTAPDPQTLQPVPGQAYRWETSADGLTYTFHLRPALAWNDGTPLTARDFVYAWRRVLSPSSASHSASMLYAIENAERFNDGVISDSTLVGVNAPDDSTLVVRLAAPTSYFLFLTSYYTFMPVPRHAIERWGADWITPAHLVSNGPFRLVSHRQNEKFVLAKDPRYWDAGSVRLDGIVAYSVDDLNTSMNLYKAGVIDWNPSGGIPAPYLPYVRNYADYVTGEFQATYFYSVNTTRPPFDNVHVRRALNLAIDREAIARDLLKGTRRAWGRIAPSGYPGYTPPPPISFDPDAARRELAAAGYPGGRGFPRFSILFNTSEDHRRIAEAIQAMWKRELNVPVELRNQEWASYLQATTSLDYDVARRSWIGDYLDPLSFLGVLRGGDSNNRTGWRDARYDQLLREADRELDPAKRAVLLRDAEQRALEAGPFLPIYHYATHELVKPYVRGIHHTALDLHPLTHVWIDRGWRQHEPLARTAGR